MTGDEPERPAEPDSGGPASELRRSVAAAAERIEEILATAERVGEEIRREAVSESERRRRGAEAEAERRLATARAEAERISADQAARLEMALQALRTQMRSIEEQGSAIIGTVEDALTRIRSTEPAGESAPAEPPITPVEPATPAADAAPVPIAYPGATPLRPNGPGREQPPATDDREAALIRATQLAVAGSDRDEIEAMLRREFELEDPAAVAGEILGDS